MSESLENPSLEPLASSSENFTIRGGCVGAVIVYFISLGLVAASILPSMFRERLGWRSLQLKETLEVVGLAMMLSFVAAAIGFFAGKEGARSRSVNAAFRQGGIFCGLAATVCILGFLLTSFRTESIYAIGFYALRIFFLIIVTASSALVSGMAAIAVRDRRESGRNRLIPQFTLQEIFIVFTLAAVIISSLTSIAVFLKL
jgi:hypothetical protein